MNTTAADNYDVYVGSMTPDEFLAPYTEELGRIDINEAVRLYTTRDWEWEDEASADIRNNIEDYITDYVEQQRQTPS